MKLDIDLRKPVLIVDDDSVMLRILDVILKKNGFRDIREAVDGQKGLVVLMTVDPCLVITDIDMPVMNGLQLVKQIRRQYKFDNVPVLALTAIGTKEMVVRALKAGVDGYLIKDTINEAEVMQKIQETVALRRQRIQKTP